MKKLLFILAVIFMVGCTAYRVTETSTIVIDKCMLDDGWYKYELYNGQYAWTLVSTDGRFEIGDTLVANSDVKKVRK